MHGVAIAHNCIMIGVMMKRNTILLPHLHVHWQHIQHGLKSFLVVFSIVSDVQVAKVAQASL